MADAPNWMTDEEAQEWLDAACDECGIANSGCECIACTECLEFGVGALTVDQDLSLCVDCATNIDAEIQNRRN